MLSLWLSQIQSLQGLEGLTQLKRLVVYGNRITMKPLANLRELRHLDLTQNQIEDLRPLPLTKLESLTLQNRITDLSPLVNLKSCVKRICRTTKS